MMKYSEIAEVTGASIEDVCDAMRNAHKTFEGVWHVGNDGTGVIGAGDTRQEAVIYALKNNLQLVRVLY